MVDIEIFIIDENREKLEMVKKMKFVEVRSVVDVDFMLFVIIWIMYVKRVEQLLVLDVLKRGMIFKNLIMIYGLIFVLVFVVQLDFFEYVFDVMNNNDNEYLFNKGNGIVYFDY